MQDTINRLRSRQADEGFTLIELLVVVVIIGVLVAIAVPVYLNYRQGAADKSAQSDLRGAISAIEQWYTDNGNVYPASPTGVKQTATFNLGGATGTTGLITLSDKTELVYVAPAGAVTTYKVCSTNTGGSGKYYLYDSSAGGSVKSATITTFTTCS